MARKPPALNAGVQGATGIEFQKHCALYLFLDNFSKFEQDNFFLCIEHYDDLLFCFLNENSELSEIDIYQAKKSTDKWKIGKEEFHIILKMLKTSETMMSDSAKKAPVFKHHNFFTTNNTIDLSDDADYVRVNETDRKVLFNSLPTRIRKMLHTGVLNVDPKAPTGHFGSLGFLFLDLGRTAKAQVDQLVGMFGSVFGNSVTDHRAGVEALMALFRRIELVFNQGTQARLMDMSKRIEKKELFDALEVITTKQRAYNLWRERSAILATKLCVNIADHKKFQVEINNSFDMFKDLNQQEHLKILRFVEANRGFLTTFFTDEDCVEALYKEYSRQHRSQLLDHQVKAAIFAAYIEIRG